MTTDSITTPSSDTDRAPWFAIRLFALRQTAVDDYLKQCGLETFIPRQWVDYEDRKGKVHHELRPVVHNIIFVKKTVDTHTLAGYLYDSNFKLSVIRKLDSNDYYEIPARQMKEFRIMCNPEIELKQYLSDQEARMKPGSRVFVKFGPLKGFGPFGAHKQEILSAEGGAGHGSSTESGPMVLCARSGNAGFTNSQNNMIRI